MNLKIWKETLKLNIKMNLGNECIEDIRYDWLKIYLNMTLTPHLAIVLFLFKFQETTKGLHDSGVTPTLTWNYKLT